jgi:hypothetical protein
LTWIKGRKRVSRQFVAPPGCNEPRNTQHRLAAHGNAAGARAAIVERSDEVVIADIGVSFGGMSFGFRTRNPMRRPVAMSIRLERGPLRRFEGERRLTEGRDGQERSQSPAEAAVTPAGR